MYIYCPPRADFFNGLAFRAQRSEAGLKLLFIYDKKHLDLELTLYIKLKKIKIREQRK